MKAIKILHHPDGSVSFSYEHSLAGVGQHFDSVIDALLKRIRDELDLPKRGSGMLADLGTNDDMVSKVRHGREKLPENWIYRMHAYSGIPLIELEKISGIELCVYRHEKARRVG